MKRILFGTSAYLGLTFAWAVLWHIVLLNDLYIKIGYFSDHEPDFLLGFLAILIQGLVMNYFYSRVRDNFDRLISPWLFAFCCGVLVHSTHVVAYAAKQPVMLGTFVGLETFSLFIQFAMFAAVLRLLYPNRDTDSDALV